MWAPPLPSAPPPSWSGSAWGWVAHITRGPIPGRRSSDLSPPTPDFCCRKALQDQGSIDVTEVTARREQGNRSLWTACLSCAYPSIAWVGAAVCFSPILWDPRPGLPRCVCWPRLLLPSVGMRLLVSGGPELPSNVHPGSASSSEWSESVRAYMRAKEEWGGLPRWPLGPRALFLELGCPNFCHVRFPYPGASD